MTDSTDARRSGDEPVGPGIALRRAREARSLAIEDIARTLHLDAWMIQALEDDDFDALGAPVFAKGHLRQYGAMLGLASDDLMIAYYRVRGRHDAPPPPITATMARPKEGRGLFYAGVALAVIVIVALATLLWFVAGRAPVDGARSSAADRDGITRRPAVEEASSPATPVTENPTFGSAAGPGARIESPSVALGTRSAEENGTPDEPASVLNAPTPLGAEDVAELSPRVEAVADNLTAPVAPATLVLQLSFGDESWVEVYDADGQRLLYNMVAAGRERTVAGRAPLEIYLGRSDAVALEVNGEPYTIPPASIRGDTARFKIGAGP